MTRGLGGQSPANVTHYLKGIDFPASKQDLMETAKDNGAEEAVLDMIEQMPDDEFEDMAGVMKAYGEADSGGASGRGNGNGAHH
jgi:hypothetical protein